MRTHRSARLAAVLALLVLWPGLPPAPARAQALTRKAPSLIYPGAATEMQLVWQLAATESSLVEWSDPTTSRRGRAWTHEYGTDHQHTYTVTGLVPGRRYAYRVTAGTETHTGSFRAAPEAGASTLKFMAYGDTRSYPLVHDEVAAAMMATVAADEEFHTFTLVVGDLVSDGDSESAWTSEFFDPSYTHIRELMGNLPYHSAMGNHEGSGSLFVKYFPYPFVGGRYWSFDYGPAHFVVVDQYSDYGPGSAQLAWIEQDLAATAQPWRFLYLHEPGWSAGGHENNAVVQTYLQPLCEEHGVSVIFAGHNHYYARAVVNGIQHVTTGGGGAPLKPPEGGYPNVVDTAMVHHHCRVEIDGGYLHFTAVTPGDSVIDAFDLALSGAGAAPPEGGCAHSGLWLGTAAPNPSGRAVTIPYSLARAAAARLTVYDVRGQRVAVLLDETLPEGPRSAHWNGRDASGNEVSAGIYFLRLDTAQASCTTKLTLRK